MNSRCAICFALGAVVFGEPAARPKAAAGPELADLVFVTEDDATGSRGGMGGPAGCDAISVFSLADVDRLMPDAVVAPLYAGKQYVSPGRMAAARDFHRVLAPWRS